MFIELSEKQIHLLKRMLPTCRINAYQINDYQDILKSLDSPMKRIPLHTTSATNNEQVLMDEPYQYREIKKNIPISEEEQYKKGSEISKNNSFLKSPSNNIQKSLFTPPKQSQQQTIGEQVEQVCEEVQQDNKYQDQLDSLRSVYQSPPLDLSEQLQQVEEDPVIQEEQQSVQDQTQSLEDTYIDYVEEVIEPQENELEDSSFRQEEQPQEQDRSIFASNDTHNVDNAGVFQVIDNRTKK
jgi:hypothetical protein